MHPYRDSPSPRVHFHTSVHKGRWGLNTDAFGNLQTLFAAGARRISIGQTAMLATLGVIAEIAEEMRQKGTWSAIERSFYGFGEAEGLFDSH